MISVSNNTISGGTSVKEDKKEWTQLHSAARVSDEVMKFLKLIFVQISNLAQ